MARRHVREAESHIARQKEIIETLRRDGHPTLEAEELLKTMYETLWSHQDGLAVLMANAKLSGPDEPARS